MDRVSFMKAAIAHVEQQRRESPVQGRDLFERSGQTHLCQVSVAG